MEPLRPVSLQVADLLITLQQKCAGELGQEAALAWYVSIGGVCIDPYTQKAFCVEIDGETFTAHWLLDWLNARLEPGPRMRQRNHSR